MREHPIILDPELHSPEVRDFEAALAPTDTASRRKPSEQSRRW